MDGELADSVHQQIKALCAAGDALVESGKFKEARDRYWQAFDLLPEPREEWDAATWVIAAIGDSFFLQNDFAHARDAFSDAVRCPGGLGNVFVHLRLGQCFFELGDLPRAGDNLARAYMGGGREAFDNEDPKYFAYLKTILKPPAGQTEL